MFQIKWMKIPAVSVLVLLVVLLKVLQFHSQGKQMTKTPVESMLVLEVGILILLRVLVEM